MMKIINLTILPVTIDRAPELREISEITFFAAFAAENEAEHMEAYMKTAFSLEQMEKELCNPHSAFYFAQVNGRPVGYLKVNHGPAQTELQDDLTLEIERIYVLADFQGKGVGQLLYDQALKIAHRIQARFLWLGVWEKNEKALRFYKKNGFERFGTHRFKLGSDIQTDLMMKKEID